MTHITIVDILILCEAASPNDVSTATSAPRPSRATKAVPEDGQRTEKYSGVTCLQFDGSTRTLWTGDDTGAVKAWSLENILRSGTVCA